MTVNQDAYPRPCHPGRLLATTGPEVHLLSRRRRTHFFMSISPTGLWNTADSVPKESYTIPLGSRIPWTCTYGVGAAYHPATGSYGRWASVRGWYGAGVRPAPIIPGQAVMAPPGRRR
jgi:hypothetical protein